MNCGLIIDIGFNSYQIKYIEKKNQQLTLSIVQKKKPLKGD